MKLTIIRIIIISGILGLMVVGLIYLPSLGRGLIALLPGAPPVFDPKTQPSTFQGEIIKFTSSEADEITQEYHLWLKVSFWNKTGEKIISPSGRLIINGFSSSTEQVSDPKQIMMPQLINKSIKLDKLLTKDKLSMPLWEDACYLDKDDIWVHLKSGIKLVSLDHYLSLTIEYESSIKGKERLLQNIPLYRY